MEFNDFQTKSQTRPKPKTHTQHNIWITNAKTYIQNTSKSMFTAAQFCWFRVFAAVMLTALGAARLRWSSSRSKRGGACFDPPMLRRVGHGMHTSGDQSHTAQTKRGITCRWIHLIVCTIRFLHIHSHLKVCWCLTYTFRKIYTIMCFPLRIYWSGKQIMVQI